MPIECAFGYCDRLAGIEIPDSVLIIKDNAFYGCSCLTSATIGSGATLIGKSIFGSCSNLTTVYWNATECTQAGSNNYPMFTNCNNLCEVIIGDNVTVIPSYAFYGCSGLTSITIPDSVTSIGDSAFRDCSGLTSVYYKGTEADWSSISIDSWNSQLTSATRYYYSETEPTEEGNYWHYDTDGVTPVKW